MSKLRVNSEGIAEEVAFGKSLLSRCNWGQLGNSAINASGTVSPGDSSISAGILRDTGAYTQSSTGVLDIFIDGTTAGTQYDQLDVGTAALAGTLNIDLAAGFTPALGSKFTIMNFTSESGNFGTVTGLAINGSEHFSVDPIKKAVGKPTGSSRLAIAHQHPRGGNRWRCGSENDSGESPTTVLNRLRAAAVC